MAAGFMVMTAVGESSNTALFLGAALAATSVGITARVFSDLRALASVEARTVLGAAVADDVLGLVILTVVVRIVSEGTVSLLDIAGIVGVAVAFLVISTALGSRAAPTMFRWLHANARSAGTLVAMALAFTLAFAELADAAQLAPIVGAFVAGLSLSRSSARDRIARELGPVGHLFIPVFFLGIGIDAQVDKFVSPHVLGIAALLLVVAVIGKVVAAVGALGAPGDKWLIGFGMIPRGEVGLIFATIGLQEGVLGRDLYAALLLVVLVTTLMAPPLLKYRLLRVRRSRAAPPPSGSPAPAVGWLEAVDGTVVLHGTPPPYLELAIGLDAALLLTDGNRPGGALLDWLGGLEDSTLRWDDRASERLFTVLRQGNARAWRFLDATGLLTRALPELAEAVDRRRVDPFLVDPSHVLRFETVDRIHELADPVQGDRIAAREYALLEHPDWLLVAALTFDAAGTAEPPIALARRLANRLNLGAAAEEELALLVGESGLLRAASAHIDGLAEEKVWQVATHLDRPERARALFLLTLARDDLAAWDRKRLDELLELVLVLLEQPALTGIDARNLVERRRQEAMRSVGSRRDLADRIRYAPPAYLLTQDASDIARQVDLVEPVPPPGQVRVRVHLLHAEGAAWRLEVACRDRPGLLATVSGVVADHGFDIVEAFATTWPDGGALESFRLLRAPGSERTPEATELQSAIVAAFGHPLRADANPDARVAFDDVASPWYTLCEVECPDRPGLLNSLAVALARGGADVHSARIATTEGVALDRFELTDRNGRKLDDSLKAAIVDAIVGGVTEVRRSPLRFARRRALRG
jgi:Kef-type K+ transport system membrane component KefB